MFPALDPPVLEGDHYFTIEEAQALDFGTFEPTEDELTEIREQVEEIFERGAGRAFLPRRDTVLVRAPQDGWLRLRRPLVREVESVSHNATDLTEDELAELMVVGSQVSGFPKLYSDNSKLAVTYTHGMDSPPHRVKAAALLLVRSRVTEGPVDERATAIASGDGSRISLATPNMFEWDTGIPEVDQVIKTYRFTRVLE